MLVMAKRERRCIPSELCHPLPRSSLSPPCSRGSPWWLLHGHIHIGDVLLLFHTTWQGKSPLLRRGKWDLSGRNPRYRLGPRHADHGRRDPWLTGHWPVGHAGGGFHDGGRANGGDGGHVCMHPRARQGRSTYPMASNLSSVL